MNTIVTHLNPDVDAICSVWAIRRFMPDFSDARVIFVPAGDTLDNKDPDIDPKIIHVDTGLGKFDHHQIDTDICATVLVYRFLKDNNWLKESEIEALRRLSVLINDMDHFRQVFYSDAENDKYDLCLDAILDGLKLINQNDSGKIIEIGFTLMDAAFRQILNKIWAEEVIKKDSIEFDSPWGKALALNTLNDEALTLAQKKGYKVVIRKDPHKGYVRIKSWPIPEIDFTNLYEELKKKDPDATWFLHISKNMILNGSTKNPKMKPSKLSLQEIIDIIKSL